MQFYLEARATVEVLPNGFLSPCICHRNIDVRVQFTGITSSPSKWMDLQVLPYVLLDALRARLHTSATNVNVLIDLWSNETASHLEEIFNQIQELTVQG